MSSKVQTSSKIPVVLLSAASTLEAGENAGVALATVGGEPFLAQQIAALRQVGATRFLIEVDNVPGALLTLADKARHTGCNIEFIRSVSDLQKEIRTNDQLLVQAEGMFAAPEFLASLLGQSGPFIATVDGRDENEAFERMDLNTRWAGLAVFNATTIASLEPVPEGWSISSTLLRQAMRDAVPNKLIKQDNIQHGYLRKVGSAGDAAHLTRQVVANRAGRENGFIEKKIFGSLAAKIAPLAWQFPSGAALLDSLMILAGGSSLVLVVLGFPVVALCIALLAMLLNSMRMVVRDTAFERGLTRWISPAMWFLLAAAVIFASRLNSITSLDGVFAGGILVGLTLLARQLNLPIWAQNVLQSPALVASFLFALSPWAGFAVAVKCVSLAQLGLLVVSKLKRQTAL